MIYHLNVLANTALF